MITTVAGNGSHTRSGGDGVPGTSVSLSQVSGLAADAAGNLFIATPDDSRVRKLNPAGVVAVVANGPGTHGFAGDGGPAVSASLFYPDGLAVDSEEISSLRIISAAAFARSRRRAPSSRSPEPGRPTTVPAADLRYRSG